MNIRESIVAVLREHHEVKHIGELADKLEAALSAAEPQPAPSVAVNSGESPMRFFSSNVDNWGALEWFNRMADACEDHDRKRRIISQCTDDEEKDILEISANTSKMVMTSSAFHLARECKDAVVSALSAQVQDVAGWQDENKLTPDEAWTILCETPGITSPEEYPDHALITFEQLRSYMERAAAPAKLEGGHD